MQLYVQIVAVQLVPLQSHEVVASRRIASVLNTAYDESHVEQPVHLATGGRELYTMIAVYNSDNDDGMTQTFQHQRI